MMDDLHPCYVNGHRYGSLLSEHGMPICIVCGHVDENDLFDDDYDPHELLRGAEEEGLV